MGRDPTYERVLGVFTAYGFRKTGMAELADALNVSRQTIYNRFKSKEAVLDWAVAGYGREAEEAALDALADEGPLEDRLVAFFEEWLGALAPLLHGSAHGAEIFELGKASHQRNDGESFARCLDALAARLAASGARPAGEAAADAAFAMTMAAKGVLMSPDDREDFSAAVRRIVRAFTADRAAQPA